MTDFTALQKRVGVINVANGWREGGLAEPGTRERVHQDIVELALIDTEAAEGIEEVRNAKPYIYYTSPSFPDREFSATETLGFRDATFKPEGLRSELADIVIRAMDMADKREWDLEGDIIEKLEYNETRGYRHGGKTA